MAWTTFSLMLLVDYEQTEVKSILENEGEMKKMQDHVPLEAITEDVEMALSCRPGRVLDMALPLPGSLHSGPRMCLLQRLYNHSCVEIANTYRLHKEIIDFYEWVRPQEYEAEVRADVLQRLNLEFNRFEPGRLVAFGSYAAGLYLPTGDMDLVFLRNNFKPGSYGPNGLPPPPPKRMLYRFADIIRDNKLAQPGSLNMILHAKVPIIKFVERLTGLKIDLSFNNDSGIVANETFQKWKAAYPAMPIIVSVVKHFLMIRGLNDVAVGGLGGFSIICLVTSLVQHLPFATSPTNLGQVLVEFFNLYGNLLNREAVAIRLDPPGYIDKVKLPPSR